MSKTNKDAIFIYPSMHAANAAYLEYLDTDVYKGLDSDTQELVHFENAKDLRLITDGYWLDSEKAQHQKSPHLRHGQNFQSMIKPRSVDFLINILQRTK